MSSWRYVAALVSPTLRAQRIRSIPCSASLARHSLELAPRQRLSLALAYIARIAAAASTSELQNPVEARLAESITHIARLNLGVHAAVIEGHVRVGPDGIDGLALARGEVVADIPDLILEVKLAVRAKTFLNMANLLDVL